MATQKTLWLPSLGGQFTLGKHEIPEPGPGEILVKLQASALNTFDLRIQQQRVPDLKEYPVILGGDGAGVVQKLGHGVTNLACGDRVLFQGAFGSKFGAYQEYCIATAAFVSKIPSNISFDRAAAVPCALTPFAVATYGSSPLGAGLTPPFEQGGLGKYAGRPIVIFGGATSIGQQAIQLSRLSGFSPIITTASLHNQVLLLSLGATHVLDRKLSPTALIEGVRKLVQAASLTYVFDAVSTKDTQQAAYELLAPGGTLALLDEPQVGKEDGSGKRVFMVIGSFTMVPQHHALGAKFATALTTWLQEGKIKPNHVEVLPGGLNGVAGGLKRLAAGVSATKLVVRPPETVDA